VNPSLRLRASAAISLTCNDGDRSEVITTLYSRVRSAANNTTLMLTLILQITLPTLSTQHLLTDIDSCNILAQLLKASTVCCSCETSMSSVIRKYVLALNNVNQLIYVY